MTLGLGGCGGIGSRSIDDHGDGVSTATEVSLPAEELKQTGAGRIETEDDVDVFLISVAAPGVLRVSTIGSLDTLGVLTDGADDGLLAHADAGGSGEYFLVEETVELGTYHLRVTSKTLGAYSLQIAIARGLETLPPAPGPGAEPAPESEPEPDSVPADPFYNSYPFLYSAYQGFDDRTEVSALFNTPHSYHGLATTCAKWRRTTSTDSWNEECEDFFLDSIVFDVGASGTWEVSVWVVDEAGNVSHVSRTIEVTVTVKALWND